MPLDCVYVFNFHSRLVFRTLLPLLILGIMLGIARLASRRKLYSMAVSDKAASTWWDKLETSIVDWLFVIIFLGACMHSKF